MLGILTVEYDVGEHVHRLVEVFLGDGGVEDGIFLVGEGIQFAAHSLQGVNDLQGVTSLCALEGHVFTEVGQSLFA